MEKSKGLIKGVWTMRLGTLFFLATVVLPGQWALAGEDPDELYKLGRYAQAGKIYAESDMDNPRDLRYRYNRGCAEYQQGDFKGAMAAFSSVLRRSKDPQIGSKAAYNLGNTAFKQGDFATAAAYYRKALQMDPQAPDAGYNLELALRELEKQKKQEKKDQASSKKGNKEGQHSKDKKGKEGDRSSHQKSAGGKDHKPGGKNEKDRRQEQDSGQAKKGEEHGQTQPEDLGGELRPRQALPKEEKGDRPGQTASLMDRKRAEALLDNVKEDRSRYLKFQAPGGKPRAALSGKDW